MLFLVNANVLWSIFRGLFRVINSTRQFKFIKGRSHSRKIFLSITTYKVSFGTL